MRISLKSILLVQSLDGKICSKFLNTNFNQNQCEFLLQLECLFVFCRLFCSFAQMCTDTPTRSCSDLARANSIVRRHRMLERVRAAEGDRRAKNMKEILLIKMQSDATKAKKFLRNQKNITPIANLFQRKRRTAMCDLTLSRATRTPNDRA